MQPRTYDAHETDRLRELEGLPLASFRARALAFIVDMGVVLAGVIAVGLPEAVRKSREAGTDTQVVVAFDPFHSIAGVAFLVAYIGLLTWLWNGRTLGKKLLGIRVVSLTGERVTLWQSLERTLGYGMSALEAGFGFLQYFLHINRRTLHDRIAETIVVRERGAPVSGEAAADRGMDALTDGSRGQG